MDCKNDETSKKEEYIIKLLNDENTILERVGGKLK